MQKTWKIFCLLFFLFFLTSPSLAHASTTVTTQVMSGADDGYDVSNSNTFVTGSPVFAGGKDSSGNTITGGFRFINIGIPQGAVIESATVDWQASWAGNYNSTTRTAILGEASDTSNAFSSSSLPRSRTHTVANVFYNSASENITSGTWLSQTSSNRPPDITPIIQEIINRPGWVPGNSLSIIITDNGSANDWWWEFKSYEAGTASAPKLTITYTTPFNSPTPTPTQGITPPLTDTPTPTSTPTATPIPTNTNSPTPTIPTATPTPTQTPTQIAFSTGKTGYVDNIGRQIVRTNSDRLYLFAVQSQYSSVLKAYWTTAVGIPSSNADFSGATQTTDTANLISSDAVYDGVNTVHVLVNTESGLLKDYPFDLSTNTFKPSILLASGNPTVSGDYIGTQGVSGMVDTNNTLHIAYWSSGNHVTYLSYTYDAPTNSLNLLQAPFQIDTLGNVTHPELVISPYDGSVTVLWVSRATTPRKILARTLSSGTWGSVQQASTGDVWWSDNAGKEIDQGPSTVIGGDGTKHMVYMENFDSTGDYGRMHYVTQLPGTMTWIDTPTSFYSHATGIGINAAGEIYIIGHGHPNNIAAPTACKSMLNMCYIMKFLGGSFGQPVLLLTHSGSDSLDSSASIKWSVVGWNRPETIEALFFSANNGSYNNTTIYYGAIESQITGTPTPTAIPTPTDAPIITPTPTSLVTPTPTNIPTPTPTVLPSGNITRQVSASTDDVTQDNTTYDATSSTIWIGNGQSTTASYTGLRFTNISIPQNAQILSAHIELYVPQASWITRSVSIAAHSIGNSPTFSTSSKPSQRTLTSAKVAYSSSNQWNANTWVSLNEIKSVIQELVNRSDWSAGNSISIIVKGTGSAYGRSFVTSFNGSSLNSPKLVISYQ